jgi:chromosome segregation ATPase
MGRKAAVTYEEVCAVADGLTASGTAPTAKPIREKLGNVGSLGTIQKFLMRWQDEKQGAQTAARMLTPELQRVIFKFADEEVARINTELGQQLSLCRSELADVCADNERYEELVRELQSEATEGVAAKAELAGRIARLLEELAAAHNEISQERRETELARNELTKAQLLLDAQASLQSKLDRLHADFEAKRQACELAERTVAVLTAQKSNLEARLVEMKEASSLRHTHGATGHDRADEAPARLTRKSAGQAPAGPMSAGEASPGAARISDPGSSGDEASDPRQGRLC